MFEFFKKTKSKTNQEKVIDWLHGIAQRQPQLSKEVELLAFYWNEPDLKVKSISKSPYQLISQNGLAELT